MSYIRDKIKDNILKLKNDQQDWNAADIQEVAQKALEAVTPYLAVNHQGVEKSAEEIKEAADQQKADEENGGSDDTGGNTGNDELTEDSINAMSKKELIALIDEKKLDIEVKGKNKEELAAAINEVLFSE